MNRGELMNNGMLEGRRVVITGAASGLGLDIARLFAAEGAHVVGTDRARVDDFADSIGAPPDRVAYRVMDVTDAAGVAAVFAEFDDVAVLVNCAGIREVNHILDIDLAEWQNVLNINLTGMFLCCQAAGRAMRDRARGGSIVNMASIAGLIGVASRPAYSASKAGIIGLTRNLAVDFGKFGIRVNALAPGQIRTPLTEPYWAKAAFREGLKFTIPLGRGGHPEDVSKVALFLASDLAEYVTGVVIPVDGGWVAEKSFAPPGEGQDAYLQAQHAQ